MKIINNPYLYHPHPLLKTAADDICLYISQRPEWDKEFGKGKMLGLLLAQSADCSHYIISRAYSGIVNISDSQPYFVPPIYDLNCPDDFYLKEDNEISAINRQIENTTDTAATAELKQKRKELSQKLQLKIFHHFNFCNPEGEYRNIIDIFRDARRGLPPGGTGECAAPRLLQYAFEHDLIPVALAEFWYGRSPKKEVRVHRQFYPSCIEKCSPILRYMIKTDCTEAENSTGSPTILHEDEHLVILSKPAGLLSTPAKDLTQKNVEDWLHTQYPTVKGPMLAHRLDQSTSGIMVAAKDAQTHKLLQQGFEQKTIRKRYVAWLDGTLPSDSGFISLPICTNPDDRPRQVVDWQFGKAAQTRYNVLKRKEGRTFIEFFPLTGRTHQLRLHAASPFGLDCPIIGDKIYNLSNIDGDADRLMLHAEDITLELGIGIPLKFHDASGFE